MPNRQGEKWIRYLVVTRRPDFGAIWKSVLGEQGDVRAAASLDEGGLDPSQPYPLTVFDASLLDTGGSVQADVFRALDGRGKVLLSGDRISPEDELRWLSAGAVGCCAVDLGEDALRRIVAVVSRGGVWVSAAAIPLLLDRLQSFSERSGGTMVRHRKTSDLSALTHREREIAELIGEGACNKDIARRLDISDRTVKAHLTAIFAKLGVTDRVQLALLVSRR